MFITLNLNNYINNKLIAQKMRKYRFVKEEERGKRGGGGGKKEKEND